MLTLAFLQIHCGKRQPHMDPSPYTLPVRTKPMQRFNRVVTCECISPYQSNFYTESLYNSHWITNFCVPTPKIVHKKILYVLYVTHFLRC